MWDLSTVLWSKRYQESLLLKYKERIFEDFKLSWNDQTNEQIRNEFRNPGAYSAPDDDCSAWIRANSYWNCVAKAWVSKSC